jgi:hypothetical protein
MRKTLVAAIAGLVVLALAVTLGPNRPSARADVDASIAISCILLASAIDGDTTVIQPADVTAACDGLTAVEVGLIASAVGDNDGALEPGELDNVDVDANQITDNGFGFLDEIVVIAFVDNDGPVTFDASTGVTVSINDDGGPNDPDPADDANAETCDGDDDADCGLSTLDDGDGVVVATIADNPSGDPGDSVDVDITQEAAVSTQTLEIVGPPFEISTFTLVESAIQFDADTDCTDGTRELQDPLSLSDTRSTLALAIAVDVDGRELTRIVTDIDSDDAAVAVVGTQTNVSVDLSDLGIGAFAVICGGSSAGVTTIKADIGIDQESIPITVTSEATGLSVTASPAAVVCDGLQSSTITATVADESGSNVPDGNVVTFSVVAGGTADPVNAQTTDGVASSSVTPSAGNDTGVTVVISAGEAQTSIRVDCLTEGEPPSPPDCADPNSPPNMSPPCPTPTPTPGLPPECERGKPPSPPRGGPPCPKPTHEPPSRPCNPNSNAPRCRPASPPESACADVTGSRAVTIDDAIAIAINVDKRYNPRFDVDHDGDVDEYDVLEAMSQFGRKC